MPACMTTKTQPSYQPALKKSWPRLPIKFTDHDRVVYTAIYFITKWSPKNVCFQKSCTLIDEIAKKFKRKTTRQQINRSIKKLQKYNMISLVETRKKTRTWKVNFCESILISSQTVQDKMEGNYKPKKRFSTPKKVPKSTAKSSQVPPNNVPKIEELGFTTPIMENIIYSEEHSLALKEDLWPKSGSKADDDFSKKTKRKQPVKQPYAEFKKERELQAKKEYEQFIEAKNQEFGDELVSRALKTSEARVQAMVDKSHNIACIYSYKKAALANEIKNLSLKPQHQKNKAVEDGNASIQKKNLEWLQSAGNQLKDCFSFSQHGSSIKLTYHGETNNELDLNMDPSLFISTAERFARSVNKALGLQKQNTAPPIKKSDDPQPIEKQNTASPVQKPSDPQPIQKPNDLPPVQKQSTPQAAQMHNTASLIQKPNNAQAAQMQNMLGDLKGLFSTKWGSASY